VIMIKGVGFHVMACTCGDKCSKFIWKNAIDANKFLYQTSSFTYKCSFIKQQEIHIKCAYFTALN